MSGCFVIHELAGGWFRRPVYLGESCHRLQWIHPVESLSIRTVYDGDSPFTRLAWSMHGRPLILADPDPVFRNTGFFGEGIGRRAVCPSRFSNVGPSIEIF